MQDSSCSVFVFNDQEAPCLNTTIDPIIGLELHRSNLHVRSGTIFLYLCLIKDFMIENDRCTVNQIPALERIGIGFCSSGTRAIWLLSETSTVRLTWSHRGIQRSKFHVSCGSVEESCTWIIFDARSLTVPDTIGVLPTLQSTKFLWVTQVVITTWERRASSYLGMHGSGSGNPPLIRSLPSAGDFPRTSLHFPYPRAETFQVF